MTPLIPVSFASWIPFAFLSNQTLSPISVGGATVINSISPNPFAFPFNPWLVNFSLTLCSFVIACAYQFLIEPLLILKVCTPCVFQYFFGKPDERLVSSSLWGFTLVFNNSSLPFSIARLPREDSKVEPEESLKNSLIFEAI